MKKLSLLALLTLLAACQKNAQLEGEALRARVVLSPEVSASCVLFEVRDAASQQVLATQWLPRGDDELTVAIFRGSLPADVALAARPYRDGTCEGGRAARTPNGAFEAVTATFVQGAVTDATALSLKPGTDGDRDGYVDLSAGGADCDDTAGAVNPGALEACTDQVDLSCDGKRGCETSTCGATACIGPPAALALTAPTGSVVAGTCVSAAVGVNDTNGRGTRVASATSVGLEATPSAGGAFFTDSSCTTPATGVTLSGGEGGAPFFFMPRGVGTVTLTAFSTGLASASRELSVQPGAGSRLVFRTPLPATVTADVCSAAVQVQIQDAQGNAVNVSATTQVELATAPADGFQFFTDAACTAPAVTAATIASGQNTASFYFKGVRAGPATLSASIGGVSVSHTATIRAGAPAALLFPQSPLTLASGVCTPVTLEVKDSAGNPATSGSNRTVGLASTASPGITLSSNDTCGNTVTQVTVPSNQSSATFYVSGQGQGSVTVTATATPLTPGTLSVTVTPGAPNTLAFVTAAQTLEKGACSAVATVEVRDAANNPTTFTTSGNLTLGATPSAGTTFYTDETCSTAPTTSLPVTASQGRASFYFKDTTVETVTLSVAQSGLTSATQAQTITPLRPTELRFTTTARSAVAGVCSQVLTVEARAQGSVTTVVEATPVTFTASPDTDFTFYSNNNCTTEATQVSIPAGQSTASFYFKGTKVGTVGLTVTSAGVTTHATQDATITVAPASKLRFVTPQHTVTAGVCSPVVTVETTDAYGNIAPLSGDKTVNLTATGSPTDGNFRFYTDANCTSNVTNVNIPNGQTRASFYFKGEKARSATVTATVSGFNPTASSQIHTLTAAKAASLVFTTGVQTVLAGSCTAVTVERRDAFGNLSLDAVTLNLSASAEAEFFSDASCSGATTEVSIPEGSAASLSFKGYTGGINATAPLTLTMAATGLGSANLTQNILPTVRTGTCNLSGSSVDCTINPALTDLAKAFLTFQANSLNDSSSQTNVRCFLNALDEVRCERGVNSGFDVAVRWSVAQFPSDHGVNVQHHSVPCAGDVSPVALSAVTRARTFLLLSSERLGADQGSAVPRLAELTTTTQAEIRKTGGCIAADADTNHLQAIDYPGVLVQRGLASLDTGATSAQVSLSPVTAPDRSILLYSYISNGSGAKMCERGLRGALSETGGSVSFSRGEGDTANCAGSPLSAISWEVVEFPPGTVVYQLTQQLAAGSYSTSIPLPASVDRSRTLVFAGGQWTSGQAHGEGRYAANEYPNEMRAQASLSNASTVFLDRWGRNSSATFTVYVVQLKP